MLFSVVAVMLAALSVFPSSQAVPSSLVARQTYQGQGTYYTPGLGACGDTNTGSDYIVAVSQSIFSNALCGRSITATYPTTGNSVTVTVVDSCTGCSTYDLDFSPSAFTALAGGLNAGRIDITWQYS